MAASISVQEANAQPGPELIGPHVQAQELAELRDMKEFLIRIHRGDSIGERLAGLPDKVVGERLLERLHGAMRRLLGATTLHQQRRCSLMGRHMRGAICAECGYSDNLYLQELERLLRRVASDR